MNVRESAVAGQFYPSSAREIEQMLSNYNNIIQEHIKDRTILKLQPRALIVPHAGYIYSGFTANFALSLLQNVQKKNIIVIGPSHRVGFHGISIATQDEFHTPLGNLAINKALVQELQNKFSLQFLPEAHHEHSTEVQMPLIKNYESDVSIVELVYGDENPTHLAGIVEYLLRDSNNIVVISTDLSHFYTLDNAKQLDAICLDAVDTLDVKKLHKGCEACGKIGIEAMLLAANKIGLDSILLDYRTSADTSRDENRVVGYMSAAFVQKQKDEKKEVLLQLARASIAEAVGLDADVEVQNLIDKNNWLQTQGASFVTLTTGNEQLRGCIGSILAHRPLYKDVLHNARSAAVADPRFQALTQAEYENISVEVSLLSEPKTLEYSNTEDLKLKIRVGIDGVVLKHQQYQATFLPQVWEQLPTFELFFSHLCQKAGMGEGCLEKHPEILVYEVKKYKED